MTYSMRVQRCARELAATREGTFGRPYFDKGVLTFLRREPAKAPKSRLHGYGSFQRGLEAANQTWNDGCLTIKEAMAVAELYGAITRNGDSE